MGYKFINRVGCPEASDFIWNEIEKYDTGRVEWFKLLPLNQRYHLHGMCTYSVRVKKGSRKFKSGYRIRCSVNILDERWPFSTGYSIGTRTFEMGSGGRGWEFIDRDVTFFSCEEALVWVAGHEAFHWLRHSRQVPGRNSQCQAKAFGFEWLYRFRGLKNNS